LQAVLISRRGWALRRRAFTLAEMVMVMVIIGIVAALAVPRMSLLTERSEIAALDADLRILQNAIELYAGEHRGVYPASTPDGLGGAQGTEAAFVSQLTMYTDQYGKANSEKAAQYRYGPYLLKGIPPQPYGAKKGSTKVKVMPSGPSPLPALNHGWVYCYGSGEIIGNIGEAEFDEYRSSQMPAAGGM
jgi:prepilin-type N-terminal cleavage/methylation domain-containing protein